MRENKNLFKFNKENIDISQMETIGYVDRAVTKGFVGSYFGYDIIKDSFDCYHIEQRKEIQGFFMQKNNPVEALHATYIWINRNMELKIKDFKKKRADKINNSIKEK